MKHTLTACMLLAITSVAAQDLPVKPIGDFSQDPIIPETAYAISYSSLGCTGGPIVTKNATLFSFKPPSGLDLSAIRKICATGIGYNPADDRLYVVDNTNQVYQLQLDGGPAAYGWLAEPTGKDLSVEEIEFDGAGNLYLLKRGDNRHVYRIAKDKFAPGKILIDVVWYSLPATSQGIRPLTLVSSATKLWVAYQDSQYGPIWVRELTTSGATGSMVGSIMAHKPPYGSLNESISGYLYENQLHIVKAGKLYRMSATKTGPANSVSTINVDVAHDLTVIP